MKLPAGIKKTIGVCAECQNELYFKWGRFSSKPLPIGECCKRELNRILSGERPKTDQTF